MLCVRSTPPVLTICHLATQMLGSYAQAYNHMLHSSCRYINHYCHFSLYGWTCAICGGYNDYKAITNRRQGKLQTGSCCNLPNIIAHDASAECYFAVFTMSAASLCINVCDMLQWLIRYIRDMGRQQAAELQPGGVEMLCSFTDDTLDSPVRRALSHCEDLLLRTRICSCCNDQFL